MALGPLDSDESFQFRGCGWPSQPNDDLTPVWDVSLFKKIIPKIQSKVPSQKVEMDPPFSLGTFVWQGIVI